MRVLANLGAGRLIDVQVDFFRRERPTAIRSDSFGRDAVLDGGDVRVTMKSRQDELLEGTVLRSVARRRERERSDDDDYPYD